MHRPSRLRLIVSNVLLGVAAVVAVLWVQSAAYPYAVNVYTEVVVPPTGNYTSHQRAWASSKGRMWFAYVHAEVIEESARHDKRLRIFYAPIPRDEATERYNAPNWLARVGIDWKTKDNSSVDAQGHYAYREAFFCVPYWPLFVLAGGMGWRIGRRPRLLRHRLKLGLCAACGYDVRATPERCPECGYAPGIDQRALPASASA
jgi:hypothetical protein